MPTYDYHCLACDHHVEIFHGMTDPRHTTCPACNQETLVRQIGAGAGIIFKGSGFYQTDYKTRKDTSTPATLKDDTAKQPKDTSTKEASSTSTDAATDSPPTKTGGSD